MNCTIKKLQIKVVIDIKDPWFFNKVLGSIHFLDHYLCNEEKCTIRKLNEYIIRIESQNIYEGNESIISLRKMEIYKHITFIEKDDNIICVYNKDINYSSDGVDTKGIIYIREKDKIVIMKYLTKDL